LLQLTCLQYISNKFADSFNKIIVKKIKPKDISYEIICAAERKEPNKAYFELLAQPAPIIPKILKEEIAKTINKDKKLSLKKA
jgi:cobalamin biosynthesis Co2+ chelatase CbiK